MYTQFYFNRLHVRMFTLVFMCLLFNLTLYAQQSGKVSGRVMDALGNSALPAVNVEVKGTDQKTLTDADGLFQLVTSYPAVLVFSSVGYLDKEVVVNNASPITIQLEVGNTDLDEVVVVSYGTQNRREITGAVSQMSATEVKDMPVSNIGQKMQGKFAGVQINNNSGQPGGNLSFRVRGAASINAGNSPLIVIDGFPSMSGLEAISPDEIETITVLKDASASSLYGSRAANGVILVTTKQAKEGQKSIVFSSYVGLEKVSDRGKPDLMNASEFARYKKEYYEDAAKYEGYTGGVPKEYQNPDQYGPNSGTNWYDVLLREAITQDYNLSLTSGGKDLKSSINLNYNKQEGVILNTFAERFTGRANNIYTASDKLTIGFNLSGTYRRSQITPGLENGRNIIQSAYLMDPTLEYQNEDGSYPISFSQPGMLANPNYYLVLTQRVNPTEESTALANAFAEYKILDGLRYKISLNANTNNSIQRSFTPSTAQGGLGGAPPQPATGSYNTDNFLTWLAENTLTYEKSFKQHNFEAFVGYSIQKFRTQNSDINATEFPDDNVEWINAATTRIGNAGITESSLLSYIGRLNYNYDSKYLLSLAFRRDGSSRFGSSNKWGNFPSVSLGWVASDETFMNELDGINFLKFRASYGKVGNNNIGDYTYLASLNTNNYVFGNQVAPGKSLSGIGNQFLTWETTSSLDLGFELGILNNRLSFVYDYYNKNTDGLLYDLDIPIQSGFNSITSNIGRFDFWGHEFSVESKNFVGELKWTTGFNISFDRNLVKALGTNDAPIGGYQLYWDDNRTAVGNPIGLFYGYINTGVYMTQDEFDTQPHGATSMVGTARFKDISGVDGSPDGKIDEYDRTFIGNPNPDFTFGMTNMLSYGNFDLNIVVSGSMGNDIADDAFQSTENLDGVFNVRKGIADRWRSIENPGSGIYPRTRTGTTADFRNFTSRQVFSGTYLAVKNITLGYSLSMKQNNYIKNARVFFSTQNPFMFTRYPGMNPEAGMSGLNGLNQGRDFSSYPLSTVYSVGVNVGF